MEDREQLVARDIDGLHEQYRAGTMTVSTLVEILLTRMGASAGNHIWITRVDDASLRQKAEELDRMLRSNPGVIDELPLFGIPFAVKDNIDVAGIPTTAACPDFAYTPERGAFVVERILAAGALFLGKTNMDQFATGLVGTRSPYGTPVNPFDAEIIPGGSSSGSAVAVADGYVSFSLGTDTAGSGRVPAGYNNIVGLKPTFGRLSTSGVVPACRSLDCVSVFALSCHDAATVAQVAEGFDAADPFSRRHTPSATRPAPGAPVVLGIPRPEQLQFFGDEASSEAFQETLRVLTGKGFRLVKVDYAPFERTGKLLYEGPWVAERQIAFGDELRRFAASVDPRVREAVEDVPTYSAADSFKAYYQLKEFRRQAESVFAEVDALLVPTMSRIYRVDEAQNAQPSASRALGYYTNFVNLLDLAAVAVPAGMVSDRLPFGVTVVGPAHHEDSLLQIGDTIHRTTSTTVGALGAALPAPQPAPTEADPHSLRLCVVGAHMRGLPLNSQLTALGGHFVREAETAPFYRMFLLDWLNPVRPGMVRDTNGASLAVEVWDLPKDRFGDFFTQVTQPLSFGTVELADGSKTAGFLCEAYAVHDAPEISSFGGWRDYIQS
jgi:allophanate hydrolase